MSELQDQIQRDFEQMVIETCDRIFTEGVRQMRADLDKAGITLTEELKRSLYSERAYFTGYLEASFEKGMRGYGRFKDMKQISYSKFPNVDALKEYIEEIGVDKFINNESIAINGKQTQLFVPGYFINRNKKEITAERALNRISYAMGRSRMDRNTITRRKKPFYNVNKGEIYQEISDYLSKKLPPTIQQTFKEFYERPIWERE